mmetsp:Transcript_4096/g.7176  ORF Transcript_4096/g.7176 Transcript_4096/m.7176 type:complete len:204 (-) Transcript_4096:538-1149(-)
MLLMQEKALNLVSHLSGMRCSWRRRTPKRRSRGRQGMTRWPYWLRKERHPLLSAAHAVSKATIGHCVVPTRISSAQPLLPLALSAPLRLRQRRERRRSRGMRMAKGASTCLLLLAPVLPNLVTVCATRTHEMRWRPSVSPTCRKTPRSPTCKSYSIASAKSRESFLPRTSKLDYRKGSRSSTSCDGRMRPAPLRSCQATATTI